MREVSTTEALMTDPTTEEGRAYWQQRHDYEQRLEGWYYQPSLYAVDPEEE